MQAELFQTPPADMLAFEQLARRQGFRLIAGIDEAGRGALAGPVVAAAVILPEGLLIPGVDDSKKLSPETRERLYEVIIANAVATATGMGDPQLIDRINILQATRHAMLQAVSNLPFCPDCLLIDGISTIESNIPQRTIKKGDSLSISIAAASIIAKVSRDRIMVGYDADLPGYGFTSHKGYGSKLHMDNIGRLGPSDIHRKTFAGVKEHLA
ncbi:MAG TPA: ribonuclease HII [Deltaproteobacteria bacterium]|nr:ribonuclease HII [Deltaproteobacteria bacterium]HQB39887.1 ribonuclease HII [Deltaproteobacteria bacterium]